MQNAHHIIKLLYVYTFQLDWNITVGEKRYLENTSKQTLLSTHRPDKTDVSKYEISRSFVKEID
jgi:hypothetical protein